MFILQITGNVLAVPNVTIKLTNGALAKNIFWQVLYEKIFNLKLSGNEVYYTMFLVLPVRIKLCSRGFPKT